MRGKIAAVAGLTFASLATLGSCSECGPDADETQPPEAEQDFELRLKLAPRFSAQDFERPVFLGHAPGDADHVYVVEQAGRIFRLKRDSQDTSNRSAVTFLDIRGRVSTRGGEEGLLGLAFHPAYADNGQFFVHYSSADAREGVIARFLAEDDRGDADSEVVILRQEQPWRNHNGGMIEFGPEGYLYISFGDGGSAGDPKRAGQDLGTWLGKILRIDIDCSQGSRKYCVPDDNPFVEHDGARPEIWAFGLRNVWRFAFDAASGRLWAGDVGQDAFEEIDLIERGGNYGWRAFEGEAEFAGELHPQFEDHHPPVVSYGHSEGVSVTGGYVYRGRQYPALQGVYLFADFESGLIWGLVPDAEGQWQRRKLLASDRAIASFGQDDQGELYIVDHNGQIAAIEVSEDAIEDQGPPWPQRLSELKIFDNLEKQIPRESYVAYEVHAPLWSDAAVKRRWLRVPQGANFDKVNYTPRESWKFPEGTVVVKSFMHPAHPERPLETRVIRRLASGWQAVSYVWNAELDDATLATDGADLEVTGDNGDFIWRVPSAQDCRACHTKAAGFVLGLSSPQLDRPGPDASDGQLEQFSRHGWLAGLPATRDENLQLVDPHADSAKLERRARAYLHANCAHCHRPGGTASATIDLRWHIPLEETGILDAEANQGDLGIDGGRLLVAGHPERSVLLDRMARRDFVAMPPVGSALADTDGVRLIEDWIRKLD